MSDHEDKINEFLKSMAFSAQLTPIAGTSVKYAEVTHMNVNVSIYLADQYILVQYIMSFMPNTNITPFFRRLLSLQMHLGGIFFVVDDEQNWIALRACRRLEGLDFVEFKFMLDDIGTVYWQNVPNLIQEFQLPMEPSADVG